jgi:hypothetical protein
MDMPSSAVAQATQPDQLPSERIAGSMLPRVLTSFDLVAIFVCIVLFLSNSAILAGGAGPAAYVYWALGFLTFLIPGAIITGRSMANRSLAARRGDCGNNWAFLCTLPLAAAFHPAGD